MDVEGEKYQSITNPRPAGKDGGRRRRLDKFKFGSSRDEKEAKRYFFVPARRGGEKW
jgi:hypothetical protein